MKDQLNSSILKADRSEALKIANTLGAVTTPNGKKPFRVLIEKDLIQVKSPLKDDDGKWILNDEGKAKMFVVLRWEKSAIGQKIEWNPDVITI